MREWFFIVDQSSVDFILRVYSGINLLVIDWADIETEIQHNEDETGVKRLTQPEKDIEIVLFD